MQVGPWFRPIAIQQSSGALQVATPIFNPPGRHIQCGAVDNGLGHNPRGEIPRCTLGARFCPLLRTSESGNSFFFKNLDEFVLKIAAPGGAQHVTLCRWLMAGGRGKPPPSEAPVDRQDRNTPVPMRATAAAGLRPQGEMVLAGPTVPIGLQDKEAPAVCSFRLIRYTLNRWFSFPTLCKGNCGLPGSLDHFSGRPFFGPSKPLGRANAAK